MIQAGPLAVFAGTSEGRILCERLAAHGRAARVFTATDYGGELVDDLPGMEVHTGRLDCAGMVGALKGIACVVDATHPFAVEASRTIRSAAAACGASYVRLARDGVARQDGARYVASAEEAAAVLRKQTGAVLLTTGTNTIDAFATPDLIERVYVRILPVAASLQRALDAGFPPSHIIAMQGPFTQELNAAMLRQVGASWLVTKESGTAGGLEEKVAACRDAAAQAIVIARPREDAGARSLGEVCDLLGV